MQLIHNSFKLIAIAIMATSWSCAQQPPTIQKVAVPCCQCCDANGKNCKCCLCS
ncbi:MAG: hypothetical protein SAJ12_07575 [Jaaginema sp. PMC 1079.18]|nr:hypothetical protein [Jaaginema sp. PMC 1080.18]MEC4850857.1 hypothetical protein [Jaaginema sp. PMC 1079.18]